MFRTDTEQNAWKGTLTQPEKQKVVLLVPLPSPYIEDRHLVPMVGDLVCERGCGLHLSNVFNIQDP